MSYVVVVECIIQNKNRFLFIKRPNGVHAGGLLAFPGGKVEYEDGKKHINILEQAIKREVLEEVGLNLIDPIQYVTSSYFIDTHGNHVLDIIFYCNLETSNNQVNASSREVPEYYWLTSEEIFNHSLAPSWIKHYLQCLNEKVLLNI